MTIEIKNLKLSFNSFAKKSSGIKDLLLSSVSGNLSSDKASFVALDIERLNIKNGERVGVIGSNGSGKSTLLKCLSGIYVGEYDEFSVNGNVAPLIEIGSGFHPELTGYENILLSLSIFGIYRNDGLVSKIIDYSDLQDKIHTPIKYYSTGMNLRLGFSIFSQLNPDVLIIDEFFAGGDHSFLVKSSNTIKTMIDSARILIIVSHELDHVRKHCNRLLVLKHGRILYDGDVDAGIHFYLNSY